MDSNKTRLGPNNINIIGLFVLALMWLSVSSAMAEPMRAQAIMMTNSQYGVSQRLGVAVFTQEEHGGPVRVTAQLTFARVTQDTQVAIIVHAYGNLTHGCDSTGPHYNPDRQQHGGPSDQVRHIGDLGNVDIKNKHCSIDITDGSVQLSGPHSIVGRALVIHMRADDMGKGGNEESLLTGNVGLAQACGIIGVASDFSQSPQSHVASQTSPNTASTPSTIGKGMNVVSVIFLFYFLRCMVGNRW